MAAAGLGERNDPMGCTRPGMSPGRRPTLRIDVECMRSVEKRASEERTESSIPMAELAVRGCPEHEALSITLSINWRAPWAAMA